MTVEPIILEVKNLQKVFKGDLLKKPTHALRGVNCQFIEGTINLLSGHNGAGKTTTIKIILGLLKETAGEVLYKGRPIRIEDKKDFGYMPEIHRLSPLLTPYETIKNHIRYYHKAAIGGEKKVVIHEHLHRLGLYEHRKKKVKDLSKGLRRRLSYILAVIHNPKVLFLDEPFSGLDLAGKELMGTLLAEQKARKNTLILSSHDVHSGFTLCDHFQMIQNGITAFNSLSASTEILSDIYKISVTGIDFHHLHKYIETPGSQVQIGETKGYGHELLVRGYESATQTLGKFLADGVLVQSFSLYGEADQMAAWVSGKLAAAMPFASQPESKLASELKQAS